MRHKKIVCPYCHNITNSKANYCPYCGSKIFKIYIPIVQKFWILPLFLPYYLVKRLSYKVWLTSNYLVRELFNWLKFLVLGTILSLIFLIGVSFFIIGLSLPIFTIFAFPNEELKFLLSLIISLCSFIISWEIKSSINKRVSLSWNKK